MPGLFAKAATAKETSVTASASTFVSASAYVTLSLLPASTTSLATQPPEFRDCRFAPQHYCQFAFNTGCSLCCN